MCHFIWRQQVTRKRLELATWLRDPYFVILVQQLQAQSLPLPLHQRRQARPPPPHPLPPSSAMSSVTSTSTSSATSGTTSTTTSATSSTTSSCISTASSNSLVILAKPHQPRNFHFPRREFGQSVVVKWGFQPSWFDRWPWLHYSEDHDVVLCFMCVRAHSENKLTWSANAEAAFLAKEFANWKDKQVSRRSCAEGSEHTCHNPRYCRKPFSATQTWKTRSSTFSLKLLSNIRFLARQGLPLQGHADETDSNVSQLFRLRGEDDPRTETWLKKKTDKYTSADIQNEILGLMA